MSMARTLSIVLFTLVALAHLLRLALGWQVTVDAMVIPMWVSIAGTLVPAALAVMLWKEKAD